MTLIHWNGFLKMPMGQIRYGIRVFDIILKYIPNTYQSIGWHLPSGLYHKVWQAFCHLQLMALYPIESLQLHHSVRGQVLLPDRRLWLLGDCKLMYLHEKREKTISPILIRVKCTMTIGTIDMCCQFMLCKWIKWKLDYKIEHCPLSIVRYSFHFTTLRQNEWKNSQRIYTFCSHVQQCLRYWMWMHGKCC